MGACSPIGQRVRVERHETVLKFLLGRELVLRLRPRRGDRSAVIDLRHVVGPHSRRSETPANDERPKQCYSGRVYRAAYDRLVADLGARTGVSEYLQLLRVAAELGVDLVARR